MYKVHYNGKWDEKYCFNSLQEAKLYVENSFKKFDEEYQPLYELKAEYFWEKTNNKLRYYRIPLYLNNKKGSPYCCETIIEYPYLKKDK